MKVNPYWLVEDLIQYFFRNVSQRSGKPFAASDLTDHALFLPFVSKSRSTEDLYGCWLKPDRLLLHYFNTYNGLKNVNCPYSYHALY